MRRLPKPHPFIADTYATFIVARLPIADLAAAEPPARAAPRDALDRRHRGPLDARLALLQGLTERWQRYQASEIDRMIEPVDDMKHRLGRGERQYLKVGRSAIELITDAMMLARRTQLPRILDIPCGGGRVTRHLVKFFPESEISASDIERGAGLRGLALRRKPVECPPNFSTPLPEQYNLIFVGSLFSHLDAGLFERALTSSSTGSPPKASW